MLFMTCILVTFFFGLYLGGGRVVYASWREGDKRLPYLCQVGAGLPALPALIQAQLMKGHEPSAPLWGGLMAPPIMREQIVAREAMPTDAFVEIGSDRYVSSRYDQLGDWHFTLHRYFELGTIYTMIAGLLNILVIYDAAAGPLLPDRRQKKKSEQKPTAKPAEKPPDKPAPKIEPSPA
jgi:hypothetical protein